MAQRSTLQPTTVGQRAGAASTRAGDVPRHPRRGPDAVRAAHGRIGNGALSAVLAKGRSVDAPDSPLEREADAFAEAVVRGSTPPAIGGAGSPSSSGGCACHAGGSPCQRCATQAKARSSAQGATSAPAADRPATGGHALHPTAQAAIGAAGVSADHVRVHTGPEAIGAADRLDARAFTIGADVAFGAGNYQPDTPDGLRLIAHEVAHTLQAASAPDGLIHREPAVGGAVSEQTDAGPCAVDAASLTNTGLLHQLNRARVYLSDHKRGTDQTYDYANLLRRLTDERKSRVAAGAVWLATKGMLDAPPTLYSLVAGDGLGISVNRVDGASQGGLVKQSGTVYVTPEQFDRFLDGQNIPRVNADDYFGTRDPAKADPLKINLPGAARTELQPDLPDPGTFLPFSLGAKDPFAPFGLPLDLLGRTRSGSGSGSADPFKIPGFHDQTYVAMAAQVLNELRGSPSRVDTGGTELVFRPQATPTADRGDLTDANGLPIHLSPLVFQPTGGAGAPKGTGTGSSPMLLDLTPPDPAVAGNFGDLITSTGATDTAGNPLPFRSARQRARVATDFGLIDLSQGRVGMSSHSTAGSLRSELGLTGFESAHLVPQAVQRAIGGSSGSALTMLLTQQQHRAIDSGWVGEYNRRVAAGEQITAGDAYNLVRRAIEAVPDTVINPAIKGTLQFRLQVEMFGGMGLTPGRVVVAGTPRTSGALPALFDEAAAIRAWRERTGGLKKGGSGGYTFESGNKSGLIGLGLEVGSELLPTFKNGQLTFATVDPDKLVKNSAFAYGAGHATAFSESLIAPSATRALASAGFGEGGAALGGRLVGATGAAFIVAPAVTGLSMAFSDEEYTRAEYVKKMGRSGVSAAGGGLLGAAATGATAGSVAPGVGTAIGVVVGIGGYLLVDALVGDEVEESLGKAMGEQGCVGGVGPGK